jgi:hypothetical protein
VLRRVVWYNFTDVSEVLNASETSVKYPTARRNNPEDIHRIDELILRDYMRVFLTETSKYTTPEIQEHNSYRKEHKIV